jgi:hypothetical protein
MSSQRKEKEKQDSDFRDYCALPEYCDKLNVSCLHWRERKENLVFRYNRGC